MYRHLFFYIILYTIYVYDEIQWKKMQSFQLYLYIILNETKKLLFLKCILVKKKTMKIYIRLTCNKWKMRNIKFKISYWANFAIFEFVWFLSELKVNKKNIFYRRKNTLNYSYYFISPSSWTNSIRTILIFHFFLFSYQRFLITFISTKTIHK